MTDIAKALARTQPVGKRGKRQIDIVFTDDRSIAELSGTFRGTYHATDVLAFCYEESDLPLGEIVISVDTAKRQARERQMKLEQEVTLLCVHGLLHVGGLRDETLPAWRVMRQAEFETLVRIL